MSATARHSEGIEVPFRDTRPPGLAARGVLAGIAAYRLVVSPWLGPACRFEPSCSRYAAEAIARHGVLRGSWLAARRVGRCHPLGGFGYDPVP